MRLLVIVGAFSAFVSGASLAEAPESPSPVSPRELAAALEARIVSGEGAVFPDPSLALVMKAGAIRLDSGDWPEVFHTRAGDTISVSISPDSSRYEFRDGNGTLLWTEIPDSVPPDGWVASFRRASEDPSPMDPLFDPSRIMMLWSVLDGDNPQSQASFGAEAPNSPAPRLAPLSAVAQPESLRFSAFSFEDETTLRFSAEWPQSNPPQDGVLDLYETDSLQPIEWRRVASFPATNCPAVFSLDWSAATNAPAQHAHSETCIAVTNLMVSPLDGETVYTNVIWSCAHPRSSNPPGAFFRLGTRKDSDADGLPDAFEILVSGTDVSAIDTDGDTMPDGWEVAAVLNPRDAQDAMQDEDGDGIPNVYEFHNGTDPVMPDYSSVPRIVAGGSSTNASTNLRDALSRSAPYSVIEIAPGLHNGSGWTGLWMPDHPVLVTSGDGGKCRDTVLRHLGADLAAFYFDLEQSSHTAFQSLDIELAGTSAFQTAFWLGDGNLISGPGAAGFFRNVHVRLGESASGDRMGWFCRHSTTNHIVLAGCTVDAAATSRARGIYAVDSPALILENCSFLNLPAPTNGPAYALQIESTAANWGGAPDEIPVLLRNCLFDSSFSAAYPIAPLTNGVAYRISMENCIAPAPLPFPADVENGLIVADPLVDTYGHLTEGSPAVNSGADILFATHDFDGEFRDSSPDIGADEFVAESSADTDRDGIPNCDERLVHGSDPFRFDTDGDGIGDFDEIAEGTAPADPGSFCFALSGTALAPDLAGPENAVLAVLAPSGGTWRVVSSLCPTSLPPAMPFAFPHLTVSGASQLKLALFVDADGDGEFDETESGATAPLALTGHETVVEVSFPGVSDDADADGIPDWWEASHGLSSTNSLDAVEDPDGDWLVNLHEYWHDLDPFVFDGTNTVLSILARSIDERIAGKNPATALTYFSNYPALGSNASTNALVPNPGCWAADVDFSCESPWNSESKNRKSGTLISPLHILLANHHIPPPPGTKFYFRSTTGVVYERELTNICEITSPPATDLVVGLLNEELPSSVSFAKILPIDFSDYLHTGSGLPAAILDQQGKILVAEISRVGTENTNESPARCVYRQPQNPNRLEFFESLVAGDSSNPNVLIMLNDPILLSITWSAVPHGTSILGCENAINEAMEVLSPTRHFRLEHVSFDGFQKVRTFQK